MEGTMETLIVIAPAGKTCPKEMSRELIGDAEPVTVAASSFYSRLIADGDLLIYVPALQPDDSTGNETAPQKKARGGNK
jgi:hypothetical protein